MNKIVYYYKETVLKGDTMFLFYIDTFLMFRSQ